MPGINVLKAAYSSYYYIQLVKDMIMCRLLIIYVVVRCYSYISYYCFNKAVPAARAELYHNSPSLTVSRTLQHVRRLYRLYGDGGTLCQPSLQHVQLYTVRVSPVTAHPSISLK